jgi:hypothetical protein
LETLAGDAFTAVEGFSEAILTLVGDAIGFPQLGPDSEVFFNDLNLTTSLVGQLLESFGAQLTGQGLLTDFIVFFDGFATTDYVNTAIQSAVSLVGGGVDAFLALLGLPLSGLLGLANFANMVFTDASNAVANFETLLEAVGEATVEDLGTFLSGLGTAAGEFGTVLSGLDLADPAAFVSLIQEFPGSNLVGPIAGERISGATAVEQEIIDAINGAFGQPAGGVAASVQTALTAIPFANVTSIITTGASDIGSALQSLGDSIFSAIFGTPTTGTSPAQVASQVTQLTSVATNANTISEAIAATVAAQSISNPVSIGINPAAFAAVFPISNLTATSPPTFNVTATQSAIGTLTTPNGGVAESIKFYGEVSGTLTEMFINVYSISPSTGVETRVWSSANVIDFIASGFGQSYINIPSADFITTAQGDFFAVEMQVVGSGSFELVGIEGHWLPEDTTVFPASMGQTRGPVAPAFDAVGGASNVGITGSTTLTEDIGESATSLLVFASTQGASSLPSIAAKVGTTAMTELEAIQYIEGSPNFTALYAFGLLDPPTGEQTITLTLAGDTGDIDANCISHSGVSGFGTAVVASGTGTAMSHTVTSGAANETIAQAFAGPVGSATTAVISGYNRTTHFNGPGGAAGNPLLIGDAPGAGSVAFTATSATGGDEFWASIAVALIGVVPTVRTTISESIFSDNVPWFALCGSAGVSMHSPVTQEFTTPGTDTYEVPGFMVAGDFFDIVMVPDGGSGGKPAIPTSGEDVFGGGGQAGTWTAITLQYGVDIPTTTTSFTVNVGAGGASVGGSVATPGESGSGCSVVITGHGTISAAGGAGGSDTGLPSSSTHIDGGSPGVETFNGATYNGGGVQSSIATAGVAPGGGGSGGISISPDDTAPSGAGAPGAVFITAYQTTP